MGSKQTTPEVASKKFRSLEGQLSQVLGRNVENEIFPTLEELQVEETTEIKRSVITPDLQKSFDKLRGKVLEQESPR